MAKYYTKAPSTQGREAAMPTAEKNPLDLTLPFGICFLVPKSTAKVQFIAHS